MPGPENGSRTAREEMLQEAVRIIDHALERNVTLRLMGGLAVRTWCGLIDFCDRDYSDIDMVGLGSQSKGVNGVFSELGYRQNVKVALATGGRQLQFYRECRHLNPESHYFVHPDDHVDVFMNTFRMDHDIDLRGRLQIEPYTIPVSDLLLSKLQIHRINQKDIRDIVTLLKDVDLAGEDVHGAVNVSYIAGLCAHDWGLYTDVLKNLDVCARRLDRFDLQEEEIGRVSMKIGIIKSAVAARSKSLGWKIRARIGTRVRWFRDIEGQQ